MTKVNVKLLRETMDYIEAHPEEWYQGDYRCRTGMCFAGWTCTLSGGVWVSDAVGPGEAGYCDMDKLKAEADEESLPHSLYGEVVPAAWRAQRLLGLSADQADTLFFWSNSRAQLRELVDQLTAEAGAEA